MASRDASSTPSSTSTSTPSRNASPTTTVFFPTPEPPQRYDGKAAIRAHFALVFAAILASSKAIAPPWHRLDPQRLTIQPLGAHAAIVTFELHNGERIARRTPVLAEIGGAWRIEHLHASNMAVAGKP